MSAMTSRPFLENLLLLAALIAVGWVAFYSGHKAGWNDAIRAVINAQATQPAP
jgi:hypothetical protein